MVLAAEGAQLFLATSIVSVRMVYSLYAGNGDTSGKTVACFSC